MKIISKIISFIFPITCSCCGKDLSASYGGRICPDCLLALPKIEGFICKKCGFPLKDGGEHCRKCLKKPFEITADAMRSVYLYKDGARKLILKFKYSDKLFLAKDLGAQMADKFKELPFYEETDCLIPIPLNIIRRIKRGYNQAELLSREISKLSGKPVFSKILYRKKMTKPQFKLSKEERFNNLKNSFFVKNEPQIHKKTVLLIDDIITTGATISACASALKKHGAKKVYALSFARD